MLADGCQFVLSQARKRADGQDGTADPEDGILTLVERMLEEPAGLWHSKRVLMQTDDEVAVIEGGSLRSIEAIGDAAGSDDAVRDIPHLCEVRRCEELCSKMQSAARESTGCKLI